MQKNKSKKETGKGRSGSRNNPKMINAVQNYILGAGDVSQEQAMINAGYAPSTANKQCQRITHHPLYREYLLAQAEQVKVSKDFINLKYLAILSRKNLPVTTELKTLEALAKVNGYWQRETGDTPAVNIYQLLTGGNGDLTDEKTFKERVDILYPNRSGSKNRLKMA